MAGGRRYAVLVGCNYPGTENELHGCVNDVMKMQSTLLTRFGFSKENIKILIDTDGAYDKPTGENIVKELNLMMKKSKEGDVLFFHYSGHGTIVSVPHENSNTSTRDECIVPCDFNLISDEDFREIVNEVPEGVTFTMLSDSCHSGGLIDKEKEQIGPHSNNNPRDLMLHIKPKFLSMESVLRVLRNKTGELAMGAEHIKVALFHLFGDKASNSVRRQVTGMLHELDMGLGGAKKLLQSKLEGLEDLLIKKKENTRDMKSVKIGEDMGILLSGCETSETSADACPSGNLKEAFGAFSNSVQEVLAANPKPISNRDLVLNSRKLLILQDYSQHPCLYCSDLNAQALFLCEKQ